MSYERNNLDIGRKEILFRSLRQRILEASNREVGWALNVLAGGCLIAVGLEKHDSNLFNLGLTLFCVSDAGVFVSAIDETRLSRALDKILKE